MALCLAPPRVGIAGSGAQGCALCSNRLSRASATLSSSLAALQPLGQHP
ncbi:hypothetical protein [Xenorhabdus thuongxuanensis]|nr:hypothetical protein [Xenorhabdus thuongxuanensis]